MKLLECKFVYVMDDIITLDVKLELDGEVLVGQLFFEIDGREMDVSESLAAYNEAICDGLEDIYGDEVQCKMLGDQLELGVG